MSIQEHQETDLVSLTIDGVQVSVPKDTLVIRAASPSLMAIPCFFIRFPTLS